MLALWASAALAAGARAADHPPLVRVDGTACTTCHDDLLPREATVHPPAAEDCAGCHEFSVEDDATRVALAADEPALCLICHDEKTRSAEGGFAVSHAPVTDSCIHCHDPHASAEPRLLKAPLQETCGGCHDAAELQEGHGGQLTAATDCVRCHAPHGSDQPRMLAGRTLHAPFESGSCEACHRQPFGDRVRLRARGERLCSACHGELTAGAGPGGTVHAALRGERGRAGCLSCHDPHLAERAKLLTAAGPALCSGCHAATVAAAQAPTGHAAAAEDCTNCHRPHASSAASLLDGSPREICAMCHDTADAELATAHLGADLGRLDCTSCHTPHGSGHPKLLARNLHPPLEDGCDTCHESTHDRLAEGGGSSLCLICHEDVGEAAARAQVPHPALEVAGCPDCHNPHASSRDHLVRLPGGGVCVECHDDQAAGADETAHGVIGWIGCQACHEPHGSARAKLLRKDGPELCLSCHAPGNTPSRGESTVRLLDRFPVPAERVRAMASLRLSPDGTTGHPVTDHRVLGAPGAQKKKRATSEFEGELTCLTCHDAHNGRSALLRWGASSATEACGQCHRK